MKRVLITGGAGFIGSHTASELIRRGYKVSIIDDLSTGKKERVHPKAKLYVLDMNDPAIEDVFKKEKPDFVYHFGFNTNVPLSVRNPLFDVKSLAGSLRVILHAAKSGRVKKFFFPSSGFVYGNVNQIPVPETGKIDLVSPYAISKHAVENYLKFFHKNFGLPAVIFRYAAVYGPGQSTGAMAAYIRDLKSGKKSEFFGKKTRDYVHIDDVVRANILALDHPVKNGVPILNIGTGKETSLLDIYRKIAKLLNVKPMAVIKPPRPGEQDRYALDISKAKRHLKWKPEVDIEEGLRHTLGLKKELKIKK